MSKPGAPDKIAFHRHGPLLVLRGEEKAADFPLDLIQRRQAFPFGMEHPMSVLHRGAQKAARRAGATPQELMEAIWVAAEMRAGAAYATPRSCWTL